MKSFKVKWLRGQVHPDIVMSWFRETVSCNLGRNTDGEFIWIDGQTKVTVERISVKSPNSFFCESDKFDALLKRNSQRVLLGKKSKIRIPLPKKTEIVFKDKKKYTRKPKYKLPKGQNPV